MSLITQHERRAADHAPWRRLWAPRGAEVAGDGDGFVAEPRAGRFVVPTNTHLRPLDGWNDVPCVLALGDPGLGKSWELAAYCARLERQLAEATAGGQTGDGDNAVDTLGELLTVDCPQIGDPSALAPLIFAHEAVRRWRDGVGVLHLVLDSLDEARLPIDVLCNALLNAIEPLPLGRLRLRIACRTAVVPSTFRDALRRAFTKAYPTLAEHAPDKCARRGRAGRGSALSTATGDRTAPERDAGTSGARGAEQPNEVGAGPPPFLEIELTPLTRADARARTVARLGSDDRADAFLTAVGAADAGVFAARPQTLDALLDRLRGGGESGGVPGGALPHAVHAAV